MNKFLFIFVILSSSGVILSLAQAIVPTIIVHGGAGDITEDRVDGKYNGTIEAIRRGYQILLENGDVMKAVIEAIKILEDNPYFNAGYGSALTITKEVEMDAVLMNGTDLSAGAVGGIRHVKNPIEVARLVMEESNHVFLVGEQAEKFAESKGIKLIPTSDLIPPPLLHLGSEKIKKTGIEKRSGGTVGAVAINSKGEIVAGTSTGGMSGKLNGRVGDAPIIGAGTLAENEIAGISCTGSGEGFMRYRVASRIAQRLENNEDPKEAIEAVLKGMTDKMSEMDGGAILISKNGAVTYAFNSNMLSWAYGKEGKIHYGVRKGEDKEIEYSPPDPITTTTPVPTTTGGGGINKIIFMPKALNDSEKEAVNDSVKYKYTFVG